MAYNLVQLHSGNSLNVLISGATAIATLVTADQPSGPAFWSIGDTLSGGTIFYFTVTGTTKSAQHGLIAATSDLDMGSWGCRSTAVTGTSIAIGSGKTNTDNIVSRCSTNGIGARLCTGYTAGGTGWYLPSLNELKEMYNQRSIIGGFGTDENYLSSTQFDNENCYVVWFDDGSSFTYSKSLSQYVRPCKSF